MGRQPVGVGDLVRGDAVSAERALKSARRQLRGARSAIRTAREYARSVGIDEDVRLLGVDVLALEQRLDGLLRCAVMLEDQRRAVRVKARERKTT